MVVRFRENSMRSLLLRTFLVAFILSAVAVAVNTIVFTRSLNPSETTALGTDHGFSGSGTPHLVEGAKVLWLLVVKDPSFGASFLLPQFGM